MPTEFERFLAERKKRGASNPNLFERVRELREKRLAARTDYEKAVDVLKAHSGYAETKQRIFRLFDREGIKDKEGILNRLIQEGKISYDAKLREFPYTVHIVAVKGEEEEEGGSGGSGNPVGKLRKLLVAEIDRFANRPGVRKIAVQNFLLTVTNNPDAQTAIMNLNMDARLYGWNRETVAAIREGIELSARGGSSNSIAGLGRAEVERILRQEGWKPTLAAPRNVVDYQKGGNRVLLYPDDVAKITMKQLRYLMDTPIERRTVVWWQIEGSSNPKPVVGLAGYDMGDFYEDVNRILQDEIRGKEEYDTIASLASKAYPEDRDVWIWTTTLREIAKDEGKHAERLKRILEDMDAEMRRGK